MCNKCPAEHARNDDLPDRGMMSVRPNHLQLYLIRLDLGISRTVTGKGWLFDNRNWQKLDLRASFQIHETMPTRLERERK
jgi:hypothetical protein